jgi:hypothetical protein
MFIINVDIAAKRHPRGIGSAFHRAPMAGSSFHYDRQNTQKQQFTY